MVGKRSTEVFECISCGVTAPKWTGRCGTCAEWNSLVEVSIEADLPQMTPQMAPADLARPITDFSAPDCAATPTGIGEVDRVLGGGLVPGSVTLLGGEPGTGKSTLVLQIAAEWARRGERVLYLSGEESAEQVALRASRLDALDPGVQVASDTVLPRILGRLDEVGPGLLIVDSVQTLYEPEVKSAPGSVAQVRHCANELAQTAKRRGMATIIVGHVTKDGSLAGPRVLEHVVDTVLRFDVDNGHDVRLLRAVKHRFGPTGELGLMRMEKTGLADVVDPSGLFLSDRRPGTAGSVVVAGIDGHRPLLLEVQALVASTDVPNPRRSAQGVESGRLAMVMAVLGELCGRGVNRSDVYVTLVGGARLVEPGCDLAVAMALASSRSKQSIPSRMVVFGEVGLTGEVRKVAQPQRRLREAARQGFHLALTPPGLEESVPGIEAIEVSTIFDALDEVGL